MVSSSTAVTTGSTKSSISTQSGFVFGSNLADRVVMATPSAAAAAGGNNSETEIVSGDDDRITSATSEQREL